METVYCFVPDCDFTSGLKAEVPVCGMETVHPSLSTSGTGSWAKGRGSRLRDGNERDHGMQA